VQIAASKLIVYPGEEVILNGQGASIFVWNSDDGSIQNFLGPQIVVNPTKQTTYTIAGSGLDLCNTSATTTIYMRESVVGTEEPEAEKGILLYPNPGAGLPNLIVDNDYMGDVEVEMHNILGLSVMPTSRYVKSSRTLSITLPAEPGIMRSGVYFVSVKLGKESVVKKWLKL
jgi:hypothetical protein